MTEMPKRDTQGKCEEGEECRNRVKEGEEERQAKMKEEGVEAAEDYPNAPHAKERNEPPGSMGGHV